MRVLPAIVSLALSLSVHAQTSGLSLLNVKADETTYRGRRAVHLVEGDGTEGHALATIVGSNFKDGTIEAEIAGVPRANAPEGSRGFVGIAFRVQPDASKFECFYLRPTNARADDQLRRNHSTQYVSHPDWPWHRLRKEHPGVYESYADMEAGGWTNVKIVVSGTRAQLYVNGSAQRHRGVVLERQTAGCSATFGLSESVSPCSRRRASACSSSVPLSRR